MNRRVLGSLLGTAFLFSFTVVELRAKEPCVPHDDVSQFVCRYGKPDVDDSTENDRPRPPIVTRMLTYKKEGVRAAYVPDAGTDELLGVVRGSEGPPLLHRVPTSHYLRLDGVTDLMTAREGAAGFLTKLVGFLYDAPTQFHDWWFDGPTSIATKSLDPAPMVLEDFVSHAYAAWQRWVPEPQQLMISALKMHSRAPGHQWYWERFAWEYTVTDACYSIADVVWPGHFRADGKPNGRKPKHGERIGLMCRQFGLKFGTEESSWVNFAVCLRNELIHEARWCGAQPSTKSSSPAFIAPRILHKLNQRLITGLGGYQNTFVASAWHTLTNARFDKIR